MSNKSTSVSLEQVKLAGTLLKKENTLRLQLEKEASDLKLEKRAMKIAFREVELGHTEPYRSFDELQQKIAALLNEDLDIVEKALERGYGNVGKYGILEDNAKSGRGKSELERWVLFGETD